MKQYILIYILFCALFNANAQQKTLLYKNYIDYYSTNAKSTILTKDLKFLKDGDYMFKGNKKDFKYLLNNVLFVKDHVIKENSKSLDTLFLVGKIKNSVKVGQWSLLKKLKHGQSEIHPSFAKITNYYKDGKIQFTKPMWHKLKGNFKIRNYKDYLRFTFHKNQYGMTYNYEDEGIWEYYKRTDTIKFFRTKKITCEKYKKERSQSSRNLNNYLDTKIIFWSSNVIKDTTNYKNKFCNKCKIFIKEKFKNEKLINISIEYEFYEKRKNHFKKFVNNTNFLSFNTNELACFDIKK